MERSEWDDDEDYPSAPVPQHERAWRHPSEMAQVAWTGSEPPLALGRGLMIATGTIGALLAVAVLWAMLPAAGETPSAASVTVTGRIPATTSDVGRPSSSVSAAITATTSRPMTTTTEIADTLRPTATEASVPAPAPTVHVTSSAAMSNAVMLTGGLMVTTVQAIGDELDLQIDDGLASLAATVLLVDDDAGVAVLMPSASSNASPYEVAGCSPGEHVIVLDDEPFDAAVTEAADGTMWLDADDGALEGTPVVNAAGNLVGLYSGRDDGARLVRVDHLRHALADPDRGTPGEATAPTTLPTTTVVSGSTTTASPAPTTLGPSSTAPSTTTATRTPPVWLGVQVTEAAGVLRVDAVATDGPAARAGLAVDDDIVSIGGVTVASTADVADQLAGKAPGDMVRIGYVRDGRRAEVELTLAVRPAL